MDLVRTVSFYVYSAERSGRAKVFAFAAAYTALVVNSRHEDCSSVCCCVFHHLNGILGAMFGACTTMVAVGNRDAVLLDPYCVTDMNERLIFLSDCLNSSGRTNLRTMCALGSAVAALEGHLGLHEPERIRRRAQHIIRARTYA